MHKTLLSVVLIFSSTTCSLAWDVSVKPKGDIGDITGHEREAKYTTKNAAKHTVTWTSDAVALPNVQKHNDVCARVPEYMDGMICYKLCGGGLTSAPIKWDAKWRPANYGHNVPFRECNEPNGCRGFNVEYYDKEKRGCVYFGFWKKGDPKKNEADMRVTVTQKK